MSITAAATLAAGIAATLKCKRLSKLWLIFSLLLAAWRRFKRAIRVSISPS